MEKIPKNKRIKNPVSFKKPVKVTLQERFAYKNLMPVTRTFKSKSDAIKSVKAWNNGISNKKRSNLKIVKFK